MVGHPKHVPKALEAGVDLICAQGGEGGGHTGDVPCSILIPACVDAVKGHKSPLTGKPIYVIGAGAVYDGRALAANLMWGGAFTLSILEISISAGVDGVIGLCVVNGSSRGRVGRYALRRQRGGWCTQDSQRGGPLCLLRR